MTSASPKPRVTIGMPIYNAARFLRQSLESLLAQTYRDFELIISDNASTDETENICREFAARDGRVRYVRQEINRGSTWNFNETFRLSNTEFFKWAAYDDLCAPTYLERCVQVLDQEPNVVWVHSRSQHIKEDGDLLLGEKTPEISYVDESQSVGVPTRSAARPSDRFTAVLLGTGGCLDSYGLVRSRFLRTSHLLLPYFGSEKVLMAQLGLDGLYYEIPEVLFFARIHQAAVGSQRTGRLQRKAINPLARGKQFPRLGLLAGYTTAVLRSRVPLMERLRCFLSLARYLLQIQKWRNVIRSTLTGAGFAGEYPTARSASSATTPATFQTPSRA